MVDDGSAHASVETVGYRRLSDTGWCQLGASDGDLRGCAGETGKEWMVQVHCDEGLASHIGPRVMRVVPSAEHKVRGEALTVEHTGLVMSRERILIQDADAVPLILLRHI